MPNTNSEIEYYAVRDVTQKEIYDSYMGILRISPNKYNNRDVDDPTTILNTLVDINGLYQGVNEKASKNKRVQVHLSDSDGNILPIYFIPKAYTKQVYLKSKQEDGFYQTKDIINIVTKVSDSGLTYVSNSFTGRSTLILSNPIEKQSKLVFALGCDRVSTDSNINCEKILLYPIEAPNDDQFFNNKNKLNLFDHTNTKLSRAEQMERNLLSKKKEWFDNNSLLHSKHHVKVNGEYINQINDHNQEIPVLYTRDYVLGHYDGHSLSNNNEEHFKNSWCQNAQGLNNLKVKQGGRMTKLSWIRIDDLIWELLDDIIKGKERHTAGRYTGLGKNGGDDITKTLFGESGVSNSSINAATDFLNHTAPILGQGVQNGVVSYHTMPFHRYWFHRCRQVLHNHNYLSKNHANFTNLSQGIQNILTAQSNKLITAASDATVSSHHSLVKDFLLCDGNPVNFTNYPNISLKNANLLNVPIRGGKAEANSETGSVDKTSKSLIHSYITSTPNLYTFNEKSPRFIRGMNWKITNNDWGSTNVQTIDDRYYDVIAVENDTRYIHTHDFPKSNGKYNEQYNLDYWGSPAIDIAKNINESRLYDWSFQHLTERTPHEHKLFAEQIGGKGPNDQSKTVIQTFYRFGDQHSPDITKCLWQDQTTPSTRGLNWFNYCFRNSDVFFDNYTPVGNAGLFIFSSDHYNPYNAVFSMSKSSYEQWNKNNNKAGLHAWMNNVSAQKGFRGTIKNYQGKWLDYNFGYIDGKNTWHNFPKNINMASCPSSTPTNPNVLIRHKLQKFIRQQLAVKLNEAEGRIPISKSGFAQGAIFSVHTYWWQKKKKKGFGGFVSKVFGSFVAKVISIVLTVATLVLSIIFIPFTLGWSASIGASAALGVHYFTWPRSVKRGVLETIQQTRYNIGHYTFGTYDKNKPYTDRDNSSYQCLSSLPICNPEYLAAGNLDLLNTQTIQKYKDLSIESGENYYVAHNVTDQWSIYQKGGKTYERTTNKESQTINSEVKQLDNQAPYPSHLNLLPIIRL